MFNKILDFLFPTNCISCKTGNKIICNSCFRQIPKLVNFENGILSAYSYKLKIVDDLIWKLKYHHSGDIATMFGKVLAEEFIKNIQKDFSEIENIFLVPIPLTKKDKRIYNHAELIAREIEKNISKAVGGGVAAVKISTLPRLLIKNTKTKQAHTRSRAERFQNIQNAFSINQNINPQKQNSLFIIVDDVTTSGATINEARKTLSKFLDIPEREILGLTIAH